VAPDPVGWFRLAAPSAEAESDRRAAVLNAEGQRQTRSRRAQEETTRIGESLTDLIEPYYTAAEVSVSHSGVASE
jgi:hypothetical protein